MTTPPITRRSTLKAGAHAAWMVPTVQIVAATPAFAASLDDDVQLVLDDFSAAYGTDGPGLERPDTLNASFSVRNTGTDAAENMLVQLVIPGGLYAEPPVVTSTPTGFSEAGPAVGDLDGGWTISWLRSDPLGQGASTGSESPGFGIRFTDAPGDYPYRAWAGGPFTAQLNLQPSNVSTVTTGSFDVLTSAPTNFPSSEIQYAGYVNDQTLVLVGAVQNFGRKTSGNVTLEFWWNPEPADGSAWTLEPAASALPGGGLSGGARSGDGSPADPYTYTVVHDPTATRASMGSDPTQEELDATFASFTVTIGLGGAPVDPRDIYMTATAPDATAPVVNSYGWKSDITQFGNPPGGGT